MPSQVQPEPLSFKLQVWHTEVYAFEPALAELDL